MGELGRESFELVQSLGVNSIQVVHFLFNDLFGCISQRFGLLEEFTVRRRNKTKYRSRCRHLKNQPSSDNKIQIGCH